MISICQCLKLTQGGVISIVGAGGKTALMFRLAAELSQTQGTVLTSTTTKIMFPTKKQSPHIVVAASARGVIRRFAGLPKPCAHLTAAAGRLPDQPQKLAGFEPEVIDRLQRSGHFTWIIVEADGAARRPLKAPERHEPMIPGTSGWVIAVAGLSAVGRNLEPDWVFRPERYSAITGLALGLPVTPSSVAAAALHPDGFFKDSPPHARKILFLNTAGDRRMITVGRQIRQALQTIERQKVVCGVLIGAPLEHCVVNEYDDPESRVAGKRT